MLTYPDIDPVAFSLGPIDVHWYGIMYLCAFAAAWLLALHRSRRSYAPVRPGQVEDLVFWGAMGVVLGGRVGYVFFYNFSALLEDPLMLFRVWEGGMSFHGGLLGVIIAMALYARRIDQKFIDIMDFVTPLVPLGLGFGRLGNFIGQELWGRATDPDAPWAMVFPQDPEGLYRHPSQLYQAFLEGLVLFIILFWFSRKPRPRAAVSALFLVLYGIFRFIVEFVRTPDAHIGFDMFGWMTRGQVLCIPMVVIGLGILAWSFFRTDSAGGIARQVKG
jgi:phosphatidylglycerol:prolipoprotein diacylglycerol transferase